jgi:radical SAM protein with 4Fe4S-binding SPASM domain
MNILPPVMVSFSVTRECNLKCMHCYSGSVDTPHPDELTTAEAKRVIDEIADIGARLIVFDGGEPLMRKDIYELIAHAKEVGLRPLMGTNATLMTDEVAHRLVEAGIRALAISLDGAEAKSHDQFRGQDGSWQQTMQGIENARSAGIPFQIAPTLRRGNWLEWKDIADLAREKGAIAVEVFDCIPAGRGAENPEFVLTTEERQAFVKEYIARQLGDEEMVYRCIGIPQLWVEVERSVPEEDVLMRFVRTCCGAGLRYCCVLYEGSVYPCMVLQAKAGDVRQDSFQDIWYESEVFKILRDRDRLEGKCGRCGWRHVCGGARCKVYELTGSLTAEDPTCWFEEGDLVR